MVKFINRYTGGEMFIAEDRVEEYKALGHKVAMKPATAPVPTKKSAAKRTKSK